MAVNEALARKTEIFDRSVSYIASALTAAAQATGSPLPTLYGPNNQPIPPDSYYSYRRAAAKRTGTMKTWLPQRLLVKQADALERQFIVQRAVDLANGEP